MDEKQIFLCKTLGPVQMHPKHFCPVRRQVVCWISWYVHIAQTAKIWFVKFNFLLLRWCNIDRGAAADVGAAAASESGEGSRRVHPSGTAALAGTRFLHEGAVRNPAGAAAAELQEGQAGHRGVRLHSDHHGPGRQHGRQHGGNGAVAHLWTGNFSFCA